MTDNQLMNELLLIQKGIDLAEAREKVPTFVMELKALQESIRVVISEVRSRNEATFSDVGP